MKWMYGINFGVIYKKMLRKCVDREKSQGHRGHKIVKCEISQTLVMINLYVKFNVHSSFAKQVIVLKVADRRTDGQTDGRTDAPGDDNRHPPKLWLKPKNVVVN